MTLASMLPALPEIYLTTAICVLLLIDVFFGKDRRSLTAALTLLALVGGALLTATCGAVATRTLLFNGLYVADSLGTVLKVAGFVVVALALFYSGGYLDRRHMRGGEYYILALTALLGIFVLISANSLLTIYIGVELLALSLYALVAFDRDSGIAAEAAIKYFVLGAIASGMLLYGLSMLYGMTGTLDLDRLAIEAASAQGAGILIGTAFVVVAVAFKFGAVPFHMWVPDVYHGAPTAVTLFIGSAPKLAAYAFVMRLLVDGLQPAIVDWQQMLVVMAVMSLAIGNLAAIMQTNIKRMLAYSTISHMGFVLLGILSGSLAGYSAAMFYVMTYVLMSLGAFGIIIYLSHAGFEAEGLDDFKGLNARRPWLAAVMAMMLLSMAGLPPFVGFYAKLTVLQALVGAGWLWLAVVAVMFSLVGAFYYLRVVKLMYFDAPHADAPAIVAQDDARLLLSANGLAILLLGILPQPLLTMCAYSVQLSMH
jgi:NADH-quinone oxidoreductase subunit N